MLAATLAGTLECAAVPGESANKSRGRVTEVSAQAVTLDVGEGRSLKVFTQQDYSERVFPGSEVTVWHRSRTGVESLDRIEYPLEYLPVPPADFIPQIKRVVLLPSSNAGDADEIFTAIERQLESEHGWVVAHRMLAEEVRRREAKARGVNPDQAMPRDGAEPEPIEAASRELVQKVAEAARADAVLEARVEYSMLKVNSHTAEWDGQRENFGTTGARVTMAMTLRPVRGQVPVATAVLKLFDGRGRLLWSARRGFCVLALQVSSKNEFRDRPLAEAAQDPAFLEAWLAPIFDSWRQAPSTPLTAIARD